MVSFVPTYSPSCPSHTVHRDIVTFLTFSPERTGHRPPKHSESSTRTFQPSHSFKSTKEGVQLEIELPGVAKEHITVEVQGKKLLLIGKRFEHGVASTLSTKDSGNSVREKDNEEKREGGAVEQVIPTIVYKLGLKLGERVEINAIRAEGLQDGVLVVWIPFKKPEMRRIEIA